MDFVKIRVNEDYVRLGFICLTLVIIYLFIITPLELNKRGYFFFQDLITRYGYDLFYATHKSPDITIVAIDDTSLREVGLKWPWPRIKFAELIDKICSYQPKVVAVDISFVGQSSYGRDDDKALAESIKKAKRIVLASYIGKDGLLVEPVEEIKQQASTVGFVNKITDEHSIVRFERPFALLQGGITEFSFVIKAATLYKDIPSSDLKVSDRELFLGKDRIRLDWENGAFAFPIKYIERPYNFSTVSVSDILKGDISSPALIKDRLIIVGFTAESLHDIYLTPLGSMPGAVLNANVIDNIINRDKLQKLAPLYMFLFLLIISILAAYAGFRYPLILSLVITTVTACILFFLAVFAFKANIELDPFGIFILLYISLGSSRLYLYINSYIEKSKMLNLLIMDQDSGQYNIYYLVLKLQQQLKASKDKAELPTLILLGVLDNKGKPLPSLDIEIKKEFVANIVSIVKEYVNPLNGLVARTGDLEFGIMIPRYKRQHIDQLTGSIYQRMDNLKLLLSKEEKSFVISAAIGICYGSDLEEKSAELMVYAAHDALDRASGLTDKRICEFDARKEKISSYGKEKLLYATEGRLVNFVIEDLRQRNRQLFDKIEKLNTHINDLKNSYLTVISSLVKALEEKDVYTAGHAERVASYSVALADKLNASDSYRETLREAALLHDIGKIGIPDNVLRKKGELSEEEREVIKRHEIESVKILEPATFLKDTIPIILYHHEHYDGSGYPHGLTGERIPFGSRIIGICDSFDAMTSGRGYNRPLNTEEAISALRKSAGTQFDPDLVEKFIEILKESSSNIGQK